MGIDFSKKEEREGYLQSKLDDLLDGINASYGQALLDELMLRLESTVDDFNKEVDDLMGSLKKSSKEKEKLIQKIKAGESKKLESIPDDSATEDDSPRELSEWEKRLEGMS
jgi:DNA anti-recombination protein RmuC